MAKRSDFAQKLLDDLRLRKERMAASQSSNPSTTVSVDSYTYAKQMYKESRDLKTHKTGGNKASKAFHGGGRSVPVQETSQQVVLYGKGHKPERIDLSMALAFAVENRGNIRKMDSLSQTSILDALDHIVGKHMDFRKSERRDSIRIYHPSTSSFPNFSHEHIKEISKGAIKLNQVLRACSNGLSFGTYSVEIGRELLKGATELEESLRMLVNLQEASEDTVTLNRKSRITLLDDDEEDNDVKEESGTKQLDRPCFSFDKASKTAHKIQELDKTDIKKRLIALEYQKETTNHKKVSHKRSLSYSPDVKTSGALYEQNTEISSSQLRPEKGRIPNVVAKLMGLELPENAETKYTVHEKPSSKQKTENIILKKATERRYNDTEYKANKPELAVPHTVKPNSTQSERVSLDQKPAFKLQAGKKVATHSVILDMVMHHGKRSKIDLENRRPIERSRKTIIKADQGQGNNQLYNQDNGSKKVSREEEWNLNIEKHQEQRSTERRETKEDFLKIEPQLVAPGSYKRSDTAVILQEQEEFKVKILLKDNRSTNSFLPGNQPKPRNGVTFQQAEEREVQNAQLKPPLRTQRGNEAVSKMQRQLNYLNKATETKENGKGNVNLVQPGSYSVSRYQKDLLTDRSPANENINLKYPLNRSQNQKPSSEILEAKLGKLKPGFEKAMEPKTNHLAITQKENHTKMPVRKIPRHVDEVMAKRNGTSRNFTKPLKQKIQKKDKTCSEMGSGKISTPQGAEVCIIKSSNSTTGLQTINTEQMQDNLEEIRPPNIPIEKCHSNIEIFTPNDKSEEGVMMTSDNQQSEAPLIGNEHLATSIAAPNSLNGTLRSEDEYPFSSQYQSIFTSRRNESLTDSEMHIKQILIKNQLFLNTAEALFRLDIPYGILNANGQDFQDEESKLILDCGYELTRRKGRMQELGLHNHMKISIFLIKVKSLDDLIKEIHKDFEKLKLYGRSKNSDCDVEDYLPNMLDEDLKSSDPDINCMWDLGWNEAMLASIEKDEVIRDVEKYMLNNLIDEALRDLVLLF